MDIFMLYHLCYNSWMSFSLLHFRFFIVHTGVQIGNLIFLRNIYGEVMHMGIEILDGTKGTKMFSYFHPFRGFN